MEPSDNFTYPSEVYVEKRQEMIEKSHQRAKSTNLADEIQFIIDGNKIKYNEWFGGKRDFVKECYDEYALELFDKMNLEGSLLTNLPCTIHRIHMCH